MSADRVLVHESIAERFISAFTARVQALPAGDPARPDTVVGPLVTEDSARRIAGMVGQEVAAGARLLTGGGRPEGAQYPATVLTGVPKGADLYADEAFGPVAVIEAFADENAAVALANDTENGLTCGIITENGTRGLRLARRLRTGIVHVNDQSVADEPQAPFGGFGASGYGRFGGPWGVETFSNTRWVTLATEQAHFPF